MTSGQKGRKERGGGVKKQQLCIKQDGVKDEGEDDEEK